MNQNQNDDELQKAIDDIAKNAMDNTMPVPPQSSESGADHGDSGVLGGGVLPMPPTPGDGAVASSDTGQGGAVDNIAMPPVGGVTPDTPPAPVPTSDSSAEIPTIQLRADLATTADNVAMQDNNGGVNNVVANGNSGNDNVTDDNPESVVPDNVTTEDNNSEVPQGKEKDFYKTLILRDLTPLLGDIEMNPKEKFGIYSEILETSGDTSVIQGAYEATKQFTDKKEQGEALLKLWNAVNKK